MGMNTTSEFKDKVEEFRKVIRQERLKKKNSKTKV